MINDLPGERRNLTVNCGQTLFVDGDDMYFGQDRLVLVEEALRRTG